MAEGSFTIARGLQLDPDYIGGGTFALLAKKGWGKTYAMRVMAEECAKTGVPFVALDPMDAFWGLRAGKDGGSKGGIEIPIFGGEHGDAPLEPTAGRLMADLVVEDGLSMVLSIAHFGSRTAERRFAMDFLDRLYRTNRHLVHLLVDEADLFAPQKPQAGDQPLLGVTENIVRRGRNKGIGITMGTQRPAVLNKDVLTQVDGLIVGRMLGPNDRNAIDGWVGEHGDHGEGKKLKDELPDLQTGVCTIWIPEEGIFKRVKIRASRTFDSSPTRKRSSRANRSLALADIDLAGITSKISASVERAKAEDPKELRKRISELERQLRERPETEPEPVEVPVEVKVPFLPDEARGDLRSLVQRLEASVKDAGRVAATIGDHVDRAEQLADLPPQPPPSRATPAPAAPVPTSPSRRRARPEPAGAGSADGDLSGPQQRVLDAIAWWEEIGFPTPTKIQVGFIAGYRVGRKVGGTYGNILGQLRSMGFIDYPSNGSVQATVEGNEKAAPAPIEQTTAGLQAAIMERLDGPERRVLQAIIDRYPDAATKQDIGAAAGYTVGEKVGGTYGNILGRLRSLGLIDYPGPGNVVALPVLFLEGR